MYRILLDDLRQLNQKLSPDGEPDDDKEMETSASAATGKGLLQDR